MVYPHQLLNGADDRIMIGMTNIYIDKEAHAVTINHAGNEGETLDTIRKKIDKVFGEGSFDGMIRSAKKKTEEGSPDYLYTITLEF